jgi:hypothetical protein
VTCDVDFHAAFARTNNPFKAAIRLAIRLKILINNVPIIILTLFMYLVRGFNLFLLLVMQKRSVYQTRVASKLLLSLCVQVDGARVLSKFDWDCQLPKPMYTASVGLTLILAWEWELKFRWQNPPMKASSSDSINTAFSDILLLLVVR